MKDDFKKITFRFYSNLLEENTVETMWAKTIDEDKGIYKLDNIPFYGPLIACDDVFYAEFDEIEEALMFRYVIECSGNSVVQIIIIEKGFDKEFIRTKLSNLGCETEAVNECFFVVDVPKNNNYLVVKQTFNRYEKDKIIEYAEPILSIKHQNDIDKINS